MRSFEALRPKLGPILYQLPPRFKCNLERLESFLALLERYGASFCAHDMPGSQSPRIAVGRIAYLRFHGGIGKYWGRYTDEALLGWSDWIIEQSRADRPVWAYFNNDPEAHAIHDAQTLRAMVRQAQR